MQLYKNVSVRRLKWRYKLAVILMFFTIFWLVKGHLFIALGRFLDMPTSTQPMDAVIVEGGQTVSVIKMKAALKMIKKNQAKKIIITLNTMEESATFAISNYAHHLMGHLDSLGLLKCQYQIIPIAVGDPFTYHTARTLGELLNDGIMSIGIVQDNFHIRRSYLTYKKVFKKKNINVYPCTFNIYVNSHNWWKSLGGIRRIFGEYVKLSYYFYKGYI